MQNFSRSKRRQIAEINIVPYVDVMLVLLVIFMITAPLMTSGVNVELPQAKAKPFTHNDNLPIVVSVTKEGNLFLNIADDPAKSIKPEILQAEVAAALIRNPKRQVLVRGDKRVSYDTILQAMVVLQHAGVPSIGLETQDNLT